jgi:hypothetical protein
MAVQAFFFGVLIGLLTCLSLWLVKVEGPRNAAAAPFGELL